MMNRLQTIMVRIYPNDEQIAHIISTLGCCRFMYNTCLRHKIETYNISGKSASWSECGKLFTKMRNDEEFSWLSNVNSKPIGQALNDLEVAYKNFFKKKTQFPKFKSKNGKQSFRISKTSISRHTVTGNRISIIGTLKDIHFKCSKEYEIYLNKNQSTIRFITVTKSKSGKYFAAILLDGEPRKVLIETTGSIGIDIGINDFVVTSDGERFKNIKTIRNNEKKLKKLQRQLSKKQKGSKNKEKTRLKLARFHEKLTNRKEHYLHKISNKLLNENQVIAFEKLNVQGMMANHHLAKAIGELSASHFKEIVKYKANWYGRDFVEIDQYFPSSKLCECCGFKNDQLTLKDRTWICPSCGVEHDRDLNAARNIRNEGIRLLREKYKGDNLKLSILGLSSPDVKLVEKESLDSSMKQEENVEFSPTISSGNFTGLQFCSLLS